MKHLIYTILILIFTNITFVSTTFANPSNSKYFQPFLKDVETYINSLKKISGTFTQKSSNGATDSGKFYINKPGKMRLEYKSPILLIADGSSIVYEDKQLDQISYIPLDANPASIILNGNITLTGKNPSVKIKQIEDKDTTREITLSTPNEKQAGTITLIFDKKPISLHGWKVRDAQGITTLVTLSDIKPETNFSESGG